MARTNNNMLNHLIWNGKTPASTGASASLHSVAPFVVPHLDGASRLALRRTDRALARDVWAHSPLLRRMLHGPTGELRILTPSQLMACFQWPRPSLVPASRTWHHAIRAVTLSGVRLQPPALRVLSALPHLQELALLECRLTPAHQRYDTPQALALPPLQVPSLVALTDDKWHHPLLTTALTEIVDPATLVALTTNEDRMYDLLSSPPSSNLSADCNPGGDSAQRACWLPALRRIRLHSPNYPEAPSVRAATHLDLRAMLDHACLESASLPALHVFPSLHAHVPRGRLRELRIEHGAGISSLAALPLAAIPRVVVCRLLRLDPGVSHTHHQQGPSEERAEAFPRLNSACEAGSLVFEPGVGPQGPDIDRVPRDARWEGRATLRQSDMALQPGERGFALDCSLVGPAGFAASWISAVTALVARCLSPPCAAAACSAATLPPPPCGAAPAAATGRQTLVLRGLHFRPDTSGPSDMSSYTAASIARLLCARHMPSAFPVVWSSLCLLDCTGVPTNPRALFCHLPPNVTHLVVHYTREHLAEINQGTGLEQNVPHDFQVRVYAR